MDEVWEKYDFIVPSKKPLLIAESEVSRLPTSTCYPSPPQRQNAQNPSQLVLSLGGTRRCGRGKNPRLSGWSHRAASGGNGEAAIATFLVSKEILNQL